MPYPRTTRRAPRALRFLGLLACLGLVGGCPDTKGNVIGPDAGDAGADGSGDPADAGGDEDAGTDAGDDDAQTPDASTVVPILGGPCTIDADCGDPAEGGGYCYHGFRPLSALNGRIDPAWSERGVSFADGYCTGGDLCAEALVAGRATRFEPFDDLTPTELAAFAATIGESASTLGLLLRYSEICLKSCEQDTDCLTGQVCAPPLAGRFDDVVGVDTTTRACVPTSAVACAACDPIADCDEDAEPRCTCPFGYDGDGTVCEASFETGAPCDGPSDCFSIGTAVCLQQLRPLAGVPVPPELADLGLEFPAGYCSSGPGCTSDEACDADAACFAPFREVESATLDSLEDSLGLVRDSLDGLTAWSACLRACETSLDCRPDQGCGLPMNDFVSLVPGAINVQPLCVPDPACAACSEHAYCDGLEGARACACRPGYVGDGTACTPAASGI